MSSRDKEYWEAFYVRAQTTPAPSLFARLCVEKHVRAGMTLFEAGCGNGTDALAFAAAEADVTAVDQCEVTIASLCATHRGLPNLQFLADDFVRYRHTKPLDVFYARFTLHAILAKDEALLLRNVREALAPGGLMLLEFRGRKNELNGMGRRFPDDASMFEHEGHRRRFIDAEDLAGRLAAGGMDILNYEEKPGFSPFEGRDETFARIIARAPLN